MGLFNKLVKGVKLYINCKRQPEKATHKDARRFIRNQKRNLKKKNRFHKILRNLSAKLVMNYRAAYPFVPENYEDAKKMYEDYFKLENHIPSYDKLLRNVETGDEIYVARFRGDVPVKGKRFAEYYINGSYGAGDRYPIIYKIHKIEGDNQDWINVEDVSGENRGISINRKGFTNFRFATQDEIKDFERRKKEIAKIQKEARKQQDKVSELWEKINEFKY